MLKGPEQPTKSGSWLRDILPLFVAAAIVMFIVAAVQMFKTSSDTIDDVFFRGIGFFFIALALMSLVIGVHVTRK